METAGNTVSEIVPYRDVNAPIVAIRPDARSPASQPIRAGTAMQAAARSANGHRFCTSFTMNIWRIGLRTGLGGCGGRPSAESSGGWTAVI